MIDLSFMCDQSSLCVNIAHQNACAPAHLRHRRVRRAQQWQKNVRRLLIWLTTSNSLIEHVLLNELSFVVTGAFHAPSMCNGCTPC